MNISHLLEGHSLKKIANAVEELSSEYRSHRGSLIDSREKALAYVLYRAPATAAVMRRVLEELPEVDIASACDCGAGAGVSVEPFREVFPSVRITLLEQNERLVDLGKEIHGQPPGMLWKRADLRKTHFDLHDLYLFSYSLNEVEEGEARTLVRKAFQKTKKFLVVIEPGTPVGYKRILSIREALIEEGGFVIAPCPHMNECPLANGDWCHFSERVSRTKEHKFVKGGTLGYEDEKYAYLVVSKNNIPPNGERILRTPRKEKFGIVAAVCAEKGLEEKTFSKKDKELYSAVKKRGWGDTLPML